MSATLTVHSVASHVCLSCNRRTMHAVTTTETGEVRVCQRYRDNMRCGLTTTSEGNASVGVR